MPWLRLDDAMLIHPKIIGLTDGAFALHVRGMLHSALYLTDGFVPKELASRYGKRAALRELVAKPAELWLIDGDGFRIHDYLEYNPSRAEVLETRLARQAAGRQGGLAKAERDRAGNLPLDPSNLLDVDTVNPWRFAIPRIPSTPGTRVPEERRDAVPESRPLNAGAALQRIFDAVSRQPEPPARRRRTR